VSVYAFLVVILLSARFVSDSYGSLSFVRTVVALSAFTAVAAFGQYIAVLTGGLDLSIPNMITMCGALLTGFSLGDNGRVWWVLPLVLLIGAVVGAANGIGVVFLGLAPVVMTLAMNVILGGVVLVYTGGTPKGRTPPVIVHLIQGNKAFGLPIPNLLIVMLMLAVVMILLMSKTVFGRQVFAVGSNRQAARLSGVRVGRTLILVYGLSGLASATTAVMLCGYGNQSYLGMGDPYLLLPLAAVVVGGTSIMGGRGLYLGVLGGAMILTALTTILAGTSLPEAYRQIIYAVVILAAVIMTRQQESR
jgi:ribose transport system permease protein